MNFQYLYVVYHYPLCTFLTLSHLKKKYDIFQYLFVVYFYPLHLLYHQSICIGSFGGACAFTPKPKTERTEASGKTPEGLT